jgi:hypothetical protein
MPFPDDLATQACRARSLDQVPLAGDPIAALGPKPIHRHRLAQLCKALAGEV